MTLPGKYRALLDKGTLKSRTYHANEITEVYEFLEVHYKVTILDAKVISVEPC